MLLASYDATLEIDSHNCVCSCTLIPPTYKNALVVHMYIGIYMLIYVPTCTGVPKVLLISALSFVKRMYNRRVSVQR
jgi:hypothetical protein